MSLREMRRTRAVTQQALADHVGVTQAYICALENGKRTNPSLRILERMAEKLETNIEAIIATLSKA